MLAQHLGEFARVDTCDAGHLLTLQPIGKTLLGIPMGIACAVVGHNNGRSIDFVALHEGGNTIGLEGERRNAIVAY